MSNNQKRTAIGSSRPAAVCLNVYLTEPIVHRSTQEHLIHQHLTHGVKSLLTVVLFWISTSNLLMTYLYIASKVVCSWAKVAESPLSYFLLATTTTKPQFNSMKPILQIRRSKLPVFQTPQCNETLQSRQRSLHMPPHKNLDGNAAVRSTFASLFVATM